MTFKRGLSGVILCFLFFFSGAPVEDHLADEAVQQVADEHTAVYAQVQEQEKDEASSSNRESKNLPEKRVAFIHRINKFSTYCRQHPILAILGITAPAVGGGLYYYRVYRPWRQCVQKENGALQYATLVFNTFPITQPISPGRLPNFSHGLSNTCYMNGVLQMLAQRSEEELGQLLTPDIERPTVQNDFKWALLDVICHLRDSDKIVHGDIILPMINNFYNAYRSEFFTLPISDFCLADGRQADCTDCLLCVLELLDRAHFTTMKVITATNDLVKQSTRLDHETSTLISIALPLNIPGGINLQCIVDHNFNELLSEYRFEGNSEGEDVWQSTFFPVGRMLTFAIENRIYPDPSNYANRKKNTTALILDPILRLPVFNPQNNVQRGTQAFRVRAAVIHTGGVHSGHYITQVFGPQDAGAYGWREYNDGVPVNHHVGYTRRQVGSRIVEYVPYGPPVYDTNAVLREGMAA